MNFDISELEQIITEELDNILQESNNQNLTALERYILSERYENPPEKLALGLRKTQDGKIVDAQGNEVTDPKPRLRGDGRDKPGGDYTPPSTKKKPKKPARRRKASGRSKSRRQAILLQRINKDKSGASKGANITLKDLQTALASIPVSAKFAKRAKPGKYDRNTYRAIVAFQRKYRGELQDKRLDGLIGPSTVGVLRNYDKSGVFSKKLDTKGVAIGASGKMLKGLDNVVSMKPGRQRLSALADLAMNQPEDFFKYRKELKKQISTRGGVAKLSEQEGEFRRRSDKELAQIFTPPSPETRKLSDKELAGSKRVALYKDFTKAAQLAAKKLRDSGDKAKAKAFAMVARKFGIFTLEKIALSKPQSAAPRGTLDAKELEKVENYLKKNAQKFGLRDLKTIQIAARAVADGMSLDKAIQKAGGKFSAGQQKAAAKKKPAGSTTKITKRTLVGTRPICGGIVPGQKKVFVILQDQSKQYYFGEADVDGPSDFDLARTTAAAYARASKPLKRIEDVPIWNKVKGICAKQMKR